MTIFPDLDPPRLPTRAETRAMVTEFGTRVREVAKEGGNVHQLSLDHTDELRAFMAKLPEADALTFSKLYSEECSANAAAANDIVAAAAKKQSIGEQVLRGVIATLVLFGIIRLAGC